MDEYSFLGKLKVEAFAAIVFLLVCVSAIIYFLNIPTSSEQVSGTVIRNSASVDYKSGIGTIEFVELESGRMISVSLPAGMALPQEGSRVIVTRYVKRFFGDSFGLVK